MRTAADGAVACAEGSHGSHGDESEEIPNSAGSSNSGAGVHRRARGRYHSLPSACSIGD
jgi:hypothetical protein